MGRYQKLLPASWVQDNVLRVDLDSFNGSPPFGVFSVGSPISYPVEDGLVITRAHGEAQTAPVGHRERRLQQDQALCGLAQVNARMHWTGIAGQYFVCSPVYDPLVVVTGEH